MWIASILQVLVLGAGELAAPAADASPPPPIFWRQPLFSIPFHVQQAEMPGQEPVEVQLFVSPDRGLRWDNWRQASPQKGYFLFRAGADGEYWFDVRTVDRSGQVRPQGPHSAKLIVVVDTVPPKVQLSAQRGDAGQITASFRIDEPYLKSDSLALEYRSGASDSSPASWQAMSLGPAAIHSSNGVHTGEITWQTPGASGPNNAIPTEVRLRVTDLAGNMAEGHAQVITAATGATAVNPARPEGVNITSTMPGGPQSTTPTRMPWPAENAPTAPGPVGSPNIGSGGGGGVVDLRVNPTATNQLVAVGNPATPAPSTSAFALVKPSAASTPAGPSNAFDGFTANRPSGAPTAAAPAGTFGPPPGMKLRWINSRVFQLTPDTRALGTTGNVPVQLWGTHDGGQTWQSFGTDAKGQDPMLVTVPEEGVYGFRMLLQSGPTSGRPPLPGEAPQTWIGIDVTKPVGRITQAQQGIGRDADKLFISWQASDDRALADKPISLSYSDRAGGPWTTIAGDQENTERYAWQLSGSLPQRVFLRLEVRDVAGNLGVFEMPEPVTLDLSAPTAPLRDLRPLGWIESRSGEPTYLR